MKSASDIWTEVFCSPEPWRFYIRSATIVAIVFLTLSFLGLAISLPSEHQMKVMPHRLNEWVATILMIFILLGIVVKTIRNARRILLSLQWDGNAIVASLSGGKNFTVDIRDLIYAVAHGSKTGSLVPFGLGTPLQLIELSTNSFIIKKEWAARIVEIARLQLSQIENPSE